MSQIQRRLRASALIVLAVVLLAAIPAGAASAADPTPSPVGSPGLNVTPSTAPAAVLSVAPGAAAETAAPSAPATSSASVPSVPVGLAAQAVVVALARSHLGARYRRDATGPSAFDCSGLVWRVFEQAHLGLRVTSQSARSIYLAYLHRGLASRSNPQVGDIVVWGRGSHVGIYIGRGRAISALVQGVRIHAVGAVLTPFTAYLHTRLAGVRLPAWILGAARAKAATVRTGTVRHAIGAVRLRSWHTTTSRRLATVAAGTRFRVIGRAYDVSHRLWYRVRLSSGRTGWLVAAYVRA